MRLTLAVNPCVGGGKPNFAERIVFGAFHSARVATAFRWLSRTIRMAAAMLEAHHGLAGKALARAVRCRPETALCAPGFNLCSLPRPGL